MTRSKVKVTSAWKPLKRSRPSVPHGTNLWKVHLTSNFVHYFALWSSGEVLWWVCLSVYLSVCVSARISPEPHSRSLPISLCMLPMTMARSFSVRVTKSQGEWTILGFSSPFTIRCSTFAAKGIIQSPVTSCSRRDNSLCQATANRNPENSERSDAACR